MNFLLFKFDKKWSLNYLQDLVELSKCQVELSECQVRILVTWFLY